MAALVHPGVASASPESEALFDEGKRLMNEGRVDEACGAFQRSFDLAPLGGTLLGLAICHEKQGRLATALEEYERAAEVARSTSRRDRIEHALQAIEAIRPRVPRLVIDVPRDPPKDLVVRLDGRALAPNEWGIARNVDVGEHLVEWSADGFRPGRASTNAAERSLEHLAVALETVQAPPPPPAAPEESGVDAQSIVAFSLGGTGLAALAAGGVLGAVALGKKSESDEACDVAASPVRCTPDGLAAFESGRDLALGADIAFLVGATLVASSVVVYVWPSGDEGTAAGGATRLRAAVQPGGGFVGLQGAFR